MKIQVVERDKYREPQLRDIATDSLSAAVITLDNGMELRITAFRNSAVVAAPGYRMQIEPGDRSTIEVYGAPLA